MRKSRVVLITVIVTLLFVGIVAGVVKVKFFSAPKATVVRIEKPARGRLVEYVSAPGEIEPKTNVEISAKIFEISHDFEIRSV